VQTKSLLPVTWDVPEVFRDRLGESAGRQRAMFDDQHLLLVMHAPPGPDDENRTGRFFWRKPDGSWTGTTKTKGQMALPEHLAEYDKILDALDEREERAQSADDYFELMRQLNPIVRATRNLHAALQQAREMVRGDKRIINFRDDAYSLERRAELLASDVKSTLEYAIARRSEEQAAASERMALAAHRLNLLAAFLFPRATIWGLFGVNIRHGLEPDRFDTYWPFVSVTATGLLAGCVLALYLTRQR
jgi:Mg2+ and Co2+ transporter CorA